VTGFTADRGDLLVIETLPFETTLLLEPPALPQPAAPAGKPPQPQFGLPFPLNKKTYMIAGGALGGLLLLLVAAIWLLRRRRKKTKSVSVAAPTALPAGPTNALAVAGAAIDSQIESQLAERDALQRKMDAQALASLKLAPVITKKAEVFAKHLRETIATEPEAAAKVLRSWIREEDEPTR